MTSRTITTNALAVGIALAALSPVPVLAWFYDGNQLYQRCSDATTEVLCAGYVAGVADGIDTAMLWRTAVNASTQKPHCAK